MHFLIILDHKKLLHSVEIEKKRSTQLLVWLVVLTFSPVLFGRWHAWHQGWFFLTLAGQSIILSVEEAIQFSNGVGMHKIILFHSSITMICV